MPVTWLILFVYFFWEGRTFWICSAFFGKAEQVCSGGRCDPPTPLLMRLFHLSQVLSHLIVLSKVIGFIFWRRTNGRYFCFHGGGIWLLWYTPIDLAGCGVYCNTFEFFELSVGIWVHLFCVITAFLFTWKPWTFSEDYWRGVCLYSLDCGFDLIDLIGNRFFVYKIRL